MSSLLQHRLVRALGRRIRESGIMAGAAVLVAMLSYVAASHGIKILVAGAAAIGLITLLALVPNRSAVLQVGFVISLIVLQHKKFGTLVTNTESGASGLYISSADVMVVLLYVSWLIEGTFWRETKRALRQPVFWAPLAGLGLMSFSLFAASNVYLSMSEIFSLLWPYLIFFYFGARLRARRELGVVLGALGFFALVELAVVLLQWKTGGVLGLSFLGVPTQLTQRTLDLGAVGRPFGTIIHPVFLSDVLGMFTVVAMCLAIFVPDRRVKQASLLAVPVCVAPIFLASARGPALALISTLAVLLTFTALRRYVGRRTILASLGGVAAIGLAFYPKLSKLVAENFGTHHISVEIQARLQLNGVALRMIDTSPLIGKGLNNYTQIMDKFAPFPLLFPGFPAHNLYLLQLAETGFLGLFGMLFVAMALAKVGADLARSEDHLARAFGYALLCLLLFNFVEEMLSYSLREEVPLNIFWLLCGLALACRRMVRDEHRSRRRAAQYGVWAPADRGLTGRMDAGGPQPVAEDLAGANLIGFLVGALRRRRREVARRKGLTIPLTPAAHRTPARRSGRHFRPAGRSAPALRVARPARPRGHLKPLRPAEPLRPGSQRAWVKRTGVGVVVALVISAGAAAPHSSAVSAFGVSGNANTLLFSAVDRSTGHQGVYTVSPGGKDPRLVTPDDGALYSWPEWALGGSKIVYTRATSPSSAVTNIYMSNPDGSGAIQLTHGDWRIDQPKVSPDGRRLLFAAFWPEYPDVALYAMDLQTLQVTNLTAVSGLAPAFDSDPAWTPGGDIVYAHASEHSGQVSNNTIWIMHGDGTDPHALTADQYFDVDPMVSPNGSTLAYSSYRGPGQPTTGPNGDENPNDLKLGDWFVVVRGLNSPASTAKALNQGQNCSVQPLTNACGLLQGSAANPKWNQAGTQLAYISILNSRLMCICAVRPDGTQPEVLFGTEQLAINWFDWSPSPGSTPVSVGSEATASQIVFGAARAGSASPFDLAVSPADRWGAQSLPLPSGLQPIDARWAPDHEHIAFTADVSYDANAFNPTPAPPPGQTRHVHYTLSSLNDAFVPPAPPANVAQEQIFLYDVKTGSVRQITTPWTEDYLDALAPGDARGNSEPDFSPDGRYLIFTNTSSLDGESFILRLDLSTGAVENLTNVTAGALPTADEQARYSPDGAQIAFVSDLNGSSSIEVMNADGTDVHTVGTDNAQDMSPSWSPDGTHLAFASYRGPDITERGPTTADHLFPMDTRDWDLVSLNLTSGQESVLTSVSDGGMLNPEWSPTGAVIAFLHLSPQTQQPDLYVVSAGGGTPVDLQPTPYTYETFFDWR
jgi:Tol biopolymer transport system component/O-antigen ligase